MSKMEELKLFKQAKELCSYILVITESSPKKYRYTLVARLQQLSLDVLENFFLANDVYVDKENKASTYRLRRNYQNIALARLKMLTFTAELSMKRQAILPKQFERISKLASECQTLLGGWILSDRKQFDVRK